jgi:hypothetical protein
VDSTTHNTTGVLSVNQATTIAKPRLTAGRRVTDSIVDQALHAKDRVVKAWLLRASMFDNYYVGSCPTTRRFLGIRKPCNKKTVVGLYRTGPICCCVMDGKGDVPAFMRVGWELGIGIGRDMLAFAW